MKIGSWWFGVHAREKCTSSPSMGIHLYLPEPKLNSRNQPCTFSLRRSSQSIGCWGALKYTRHPIYGTSPAASDSGLSYSSVYIAPLASIITAPIRIIRAIPSTPRSRQQHGEPRFSRGSTHNLDPVAGVEDQCANHRSSRWYREPSHSTGNTENPDPAGNAQNPDNPGKNTQSPDPLVGNTQNPVTPTGNTQNQDSPAGTEHAEPSSSLRRTQSLPLKEFLQKCIWSPDWRPASLSPTGDFMLINDDWASHDLTIDEKWAAFTKKVRELSGDKIDVATLVKASGPSNSVLATEWHFPTWVTESPFYGSVMDDTNSSLRDQSSTCIGGSWQLLLCQV
ncbi:hypothetical protein CEP53_009783 [Fusarium sp. AF-6]|nr:hypothetical protein CEP53_009783 [Fusarium sp. AF-6]